MTCVVVAEKLDDARRQLAGAGNDEGALLGVHL